MQNDDFAYNPFDSDLPPAGREQAVAQLRNYLSDAARTDALAFIGRYRIGKTTLLHQFTTEFQGHSIGVYIPWADLADRDEADILKALGKLSIDVVTQQGYIAEGSITLPEDDNLHEWLKEVALPEIYKAIRTQRRLIWLIDDAHLIIDGIQKEKIGEDFPAYLASLLNPQFGIVMTLDLEYEEETDTLTPLLTPKNLHRLTNIDLDATRAIFNNPAAHLSIDDKAIEAIFRATGGEPDMIQRFGYILYEKYAESHIQQDMVRAITPEIYQFAEPQFKVIWKQLPQNERLVLTALSGILYDNPLANINTEKIEAWLVETDFPMDTISINAAIRGLEYYGLINGRSGEISIRSLLMQKWLLENARIPREQADTLMDAPSDRRVIWWGVAIIIAVVILVVAAANLAGGNDNNSAIDPIPTITLVPEQP